MAGFGAACIQTNRVLAPAKSALEMHQIVFNDYVNATLTALLASLVIAIACLGAIAVRNALSNPLVTAREAAIVPAE